MARFVHDPKTKHWLIIAPGRVNRPHDNAPLPTDSSQQSNLPPVCPFCPGAEGLNKELFRIGGEKGDPHWRILVIANKYPIAEFHEVILHSPNHDHGIVDLPLSQVELILKVYQSRYQYHVSANHGQVLIFNNHDIHSGASIKHPHSQIVVVPNEVTLEDLSKEPIANIILETNHFTLYCPNFSQWPYEIWLAPKKTGQTFGEVSEESLADLAEILQRTLKAIVLKFSEVGAMKQPGSDRDVPFNYYIYHGNDWFIRVIPRLIHRGGFELGSGLSVNVVDPHDAALEYKKLLTNS